MECPFCLAKEPYYFVDGVCRRCIAYRHGLVQEQTQGFIEKRFELLPIKLTQRQQQASEEVLEAITESNVCIEAVCGEGKTEMCLALIEKCIKEHKTIGWATPRKEIVVELKQRLQQYFKHHQVVGVYGNHTDELMGDLIVLTTHQLYRYPKFFDVLIVDEPDAFPFKGSLLLYDFMRASLKGKCVLLSATFDRNQFDNLPLHTINVSGRPSNKPLVVPKVIWSLPLFLMQLWKLRNEHVLFFVPTIRLAKIWSTLLHANIITSESLHHEAVLKDFRKQGGILVTTTVLERGITILDCFVFVYQADHKVFDESSLVQISGRVGRGIDPKKGDCYFLCNQKSKAVNACIQRIQKANDACYVSTLL